jgi:hypothetical protein
MSAAQTDPTLSNKPATTMRNDFISRFSFR